MENVKVSIILTSYNHAAYLRKSIDSVLEQTFENYELIIIDDCSTDNSCEIIESYLDERIQFVRHEYNRGGGIKEGVEKFAKGEYIAILHSDDFWNDKKKLEKQVEYLDCHKDCAAVFTGVQVVNDDNSFYDKKESFYYNIFDQPNRSRFEWLRFFFFHGNCLCHPSILVRKSAYEENRALEYVYPYRQIPDLVRWVRLCLRHEIYIIPEKLTCFRLHANESMNTSGFSVENAQRNSVELFSYNRHFLEITDEDSFEKVFPEWKEYSVNGYFNNRYALARICLLPATAMQTKLFGMVLLNDVLTDINEREKLKKYYGFTNKEYYQFTGKYDIFNKFPSGAKQISTLYYSESDEFILEKGIRWEYSILESHSFHYNYTFTIESINSNTLYFRFDPSEDILIKCRIEEFKVNGTSLPFRPIESMRSCEGTDLFGTTDPMYIAEMPAGLKVDSGKYNIVISGNIQLLKNDELVPLLRSYRNSEFEYLKLTGNYDRYDILPVNARNFCTLFYGKTKEFTPECSVRNEFFLLESYSFSYQYSVIIDEINSEEVYLRFDPAENVFIKCKMKEFKVNGVEAVYEPVGALKASEEIDVFKTLDPIYMIKIPVDKEIQQVKLDITVSGEIWLMSHEEIAACINN